MGAGAIQRRRVGADPGLCACRDERLGRVYDQRRYRSTSVLKRLTAMYFAMVDRLGNQSGRLLEAVQASAIRQYAAAAAAGTAPGELSAQLRAVGADGRPITEPDLRLRRWAGQARRSGSRAGRVAGDVDGRSTDYGVHGADRAAQPTRPRDHPDTGRRAATNEQHQLRRMARG